MELIFLIVLVVGIVLVGMGIISYRRVAGYVGRLAERVPGYTTTRHYFGEGVRGVYGKLRERGFVLPTVEEERRSITMFSPTGERNVLYSTAKTKIRPRGLELAYEGVIAPSIAEHGQDIKLEPEVSLMFRWLGHYTRAAMGTAMDIVTGWRDRGEREKRQRIATEEYLGMRPPSTE